MYQPTAAALDAIHDVTLLGVVGPSGVGKTTIIEAAIAADPSLHMVVGDASRAPRPHERDGVDYFFRSRAYMLERIQRREYVQVPPNITGDIYATAPESYAHHGVSVMAIWAQAIPVFRALPFRAMRTVCIVPPSFEVWMSRLDARNALDKRLAEARHSFQFAVQDDQALYVINDQVADAAQDLLCIAHGQPLPPALQADQARAKEIAAGILQRLMFAG